MADTGDGERPRSPYEIALGDEVERLHPRLRAYFAAIPAQHVGRGRGTFDVVGTPRRWLWPTFRVLERQGILFPVHEFEVPFSVENRPAAHAGVAASRRFRFRVGTRTMNDVIRARNGRLVDALGARGNLRVAFTARTREGALELRSTAVGVRVGRLRLRVPDAIAPRARLVERYDDATDSQRVSFTLDAPLVGRLYEYSGSFTYEVRREEAR